MRRKNRCAPQTCMYSVLFLLNTADEVAIECPTPFESVEKFAERGNFLVSKNKRNPSQVSIRFCAILAPPMSRKTSEKSNDQKNHVTRKAKKKPHGPARNKMKKKKEKPTNYKSSGGKPWKTTAQYVFMTRTIRVEKV